MSARAAALVAAAAANSPFLAASTRCRNVSSLRITKKAESDCAAVLPAEAVTGAVSDARGGDERGGDGRRHDVCVCVCVCLCVCVKYYKGQTSATGGQDRQDIRV